jgi:hypothetical protein
LASVATHWKNGVPLQLGYGTANAISVSGGNIYVAGLADKGAGSLMRAYWKNGNLVTLPGNASPTGIAVVAP